MASSRVEFLVLVAALLACSLAVGTAGAAGPPLVAADGDPSIEHVGVSSYTGEVSPLSATEFEADRTEFRITVHDDGSATWLFRYEQRLETDEERSDFEAFAEEFTSEETELYRNFVERAERLTSEGTDATGREMAASEFQRDATTRGLDDDLGVVDMSFRWDGFAPIEDDRIVVGDIFEGGLYIGDDQRLVFERGDGLRFSEVDPEPDRRSGGTLEDSDSITYLGEESFTDNRPRVVYVPDDPSTTPSGDDTADETPTNPDSDRGWLLPALVVLAAFALAAALVHHFDVLSAIRRRFDADVAESADDDREGEPVTVSEEALLPDDERVIEILKSKGGRTKQIEIVNETEWSKSKVSMLLSEMEEEGRISKLRVGRENIVSLPGYEPDAAGSPFDEE